LLKALFVECSDFDKFPTGGQLTYLKSLIPFIEVEPYLVGVSVGSKHSVGKWGKKIVTGRQCRFLSIGVVRPKSNLLDKFIPYRIRFVLWLRKYRKQILLSGTEVIYVQTQEAALPFLVPGFPPIVLRLAGATNPLKGSRFFWARVHFLEALYERLVTRRVLPRVANVVAINQECVRMCQTIGATNYVFIPLGVDQSLFYPQDKAICKKQVGVITDGPVFVFVGRLSKIKGLDLLLDGFALFHQEVPEARLLIAGDGEERKAIENKISFMGLKEMVHLLGNVARNRLPQILNAADIFVLTSVAEGVPNAILEAMACGLPVVATDVGGISEVVKSGVNGFLIDTRQPSNVVEMLKQALEKQESLGQGAIVTINKNYSIKSVARKTESLLEEVVLSKRMT
jgi:glycosyltransferase involved in cell wall biosynthesis